MRPVTYAAAQPAKTHRVVFYADSEPFMLRSETQKPGEGGAGGRGRERTAVSAGGFREASHA